MSDPLVSVIIPVYNAERYVAATLKSVLAQTFREFEIICVNDGSTDSSAVVLKQFGDQIRVLEQPNSGQTVAQNHAVDHSSGRYIAFLDADDVWYPTKLEDQVREMESHHDIVMVSSNYDEIDGAGKMRLVDAGLSLYRDIDPKNPLNRLLGEDFAIALPSFMMVRKTALAQIGGLDPLLTVYDSDTDLCVRLRDVGQSRYVERSGGARRVHASSNSYSEQFARKRHQCCVHLLEKLHARYRGDLKKERIARTILANRLSDWGWYEVRIGNQADGLNLLKRALTLDPLKFRTVSRIFRAFI
ncbi:hypothetical protein YTPLAS18_25370 [Nitrospira sp.]|nr:hypothetical protein YTPLAS18_25370 [Nitrospira sp.]